MKILEFTSRYLIYLFISFIFMITILIAENVLTFLSNNLKELNTLKYPLLGISVTIIFIYGLKYLKLPTASKIIHEAFK